MRSTLELNSLVVQEQHNAYDTKLILEENAAHLGRLSSIRYKMQLKEASDKKDLEKCQKQQFVIGGLPQFDFVTKELAHTKDPKRAKELHSQLLKLKQALDAK